MLNVGMSVESVEDLLPYLKERLDLMNMMTPQLLALLCLNLMYEHLPPVPALLLDHL